MKQEDLANLAQLRERITFPFNALLGREIFLAEFYSGFFQSPPHEVLDGYGLVVGGSAPDPASLHGQRWVITGSMGVGKSTLLAHWYIAAQRNGDSSPMLVSMSQLIEDAATWTRALSAGEEVIFVDSLDETATSHDADALDEVLEHLLRHPSVVLACRAPFFYDCFNPQRRSCLTGIVSLLPLDRGHQAALTKRYAGQVGEQRRERIARAASGILDRCRGHSPMESSLVATPLFTALSVFAAASASGSEHRLDGVTAVYSEFVRSVVARQFASDAAHQQLEELAYLLEHRRLRGEALATSEVMSRFGEEFFRRLGGMVLLRRSLMTDEYVLSDFRHRSIAEFLVARHVVRGLFALHTKVDTYELLGNLYNYETSFFLRRLAQEANPAEREGGCRRMKEVVKKSLRSMAEPEVFALHNSIYLLAHLDHSDAEWLVGIASDITRSDELHPLVFGTVLSALSVRQMFDAYHRLLRSFHSRSDELIVRNLNYHLFYYGDSDYRNPNDFLRPIANGQEWDNSRGVLLRRMNSADTKRLSFRAFDLSSFREFWHRTRYRLTPDETHALSQALEGAETWVRGIPDPKLQDEVLREVFALRYMTRDSSRIIPDRLEGSAPARYKRGSVQVAVVVALPEEFREFLKVVRGQGSDVKAERNELGEVFYLFDLKCVDGLDRSCVAALIGEKGEAGAALLTERLLQRYSPSLVTMIGIAGSLHEDVRLLDVVIAQQVDRYLSSGATVPVAHSPSVGDSYELVFGGEVHRTSASLVRSTIAMEFASSDTFNGWRTDCNQDTIWELGNEVQKLLVDDGVVRAAPEIFAVNLASGPVVAKAAAFSQALRGRRDRELKAIEMESGGVMRAVHDRLEGREILVLRGISDGSDENKLRREAVGEGALRRLAMRNVTRLFCVLVKNEVELLKVDD